MEKNVIIYTRVSDPSQIDNNSLGTQEQTCRKFAESKGWRVVRIFREEGVSAKFVHTRPQLRELITFATKKQNNISFVLVYKFDRFSRNLEDGLIAISLLAKYKVSVISTTETTDESPMGTAMRNIMITLGQLDNELKGERVKDNMQAVFKKGLWPFKCPIGYKRQFKTKEENKGLPVVKDPSMAPIITQMFKNASTGIYNKTQLAKMMNLDNFGDHYITKADHKIVHNILSKTFYYGRMYAKKWDEYAVGVHEPLIDEQTWQKAYHLLVLKKKNYRFHDTDLYPLKGALKCESCGHPMTTSPSKGMNELFYYYECKNKDCNCNGVRINVDKAHEQFAKILSQIKPKQRVIKLFEHMVFSEWDQIIEETKRGIKQIESQIAKQKEELKSIRKATDSGIYTVEQAKEEALKVNKEIDLLSIEKSDIKIEKYDAIITKEFIEKFLNNLDLLWDVLDLPKRQALLNKVFMGTILCSENKQIRTDQLSPSFELIEALGAEKGENVPPPRIELGFKV